MDAYGNYCDKTNNYSHVDVLVLHDIRLQLHCAKREREGLSIMLKSFHLYYCSATGSFSFLGYISHSFLACGLMER